MLYVNEPNNGEKTPAHRRPENARREPSPASFVSLIRHKMLCLSSG